MEREIAGQRRLRLIDTRRGSLNAGYVIWANSSALILRLVWQSSLASLPLIEWD